MAELLGASNRKLREVKPRDNLPGGYRKNEVKFSRLACWLPWPSG